jgi:ribosomal protein S6
MFGDEAIDGLRELAYSINKVQDHDIDEIIKTYR